MSVCYNCSQNQDEVLTIIIPDFLQISLSCFTKNQQRDITHLYKINLRTPENIPLYIDSEICLRDTLKQYCLYKQLCAKVEEEMRLMNLDFKIDEKNVRLVKKQEAETAEVYKNLEYRKSEKSLESNEVPKLETVPQPEKIIEDEIIVPKPAEQVQEDKIEEMPQKKQRRSIFARRSSKVTENKPERQERRSFFGRKSIKTPENKEVEEQKDKPTEESKNSN